MKTINQLDKSFGPVGSTAGIVLFVIGLITVCTSLFGLILIFLGAFVGFSSTCAVIDPDQKRIKLSTNLFGFIQTGKWIQINAQMSLGIRESNVTWRTYSQGNRPLDIAEPGFNVVLIDTDNQEIMSIKKTKSQDAAKTEMEKLGNQLGLKIN